MSTRPVWITWLLFVSSDCPVGRGFVCNPAGGVRKGMLMLIYAFIVLMLGGANAARKSVPASQP